MKKPAFLAALLLASATFTHAQFNFTNLQYPGATATAAYGINVHGDIAGAYATDSAGQLFHAMMIENGKKFVPLAPETVLGTDLSYAFKINDHRDAVGWYCDSVACHGYLLTHAGELTILDYPGASDTYAFGINGPGTIVGEWDLYDSSGNFLYNQGFMWKDGSFTEVTFPGSGDTALLAINDFGVVTGEWDTGATATTEQGFAAVSGEFVSFVVPFPNVYITEALGINDNGEIIGAVYQGVKAHGFLGVIPEFTHVNYPGSVQTTGWGINSALDLVGNWYPSNGIRHAWSAVPCSTSCSSAQAAPEELRKTPMPEAQAPEAHFRVPARAQRMTQ